MSMTVDGIDARPGGVSGLLAVSVAFLSLGTNGCGLIGDSLEPAGEEHDLGATPGLVVAREGVVHFLGGEFCPVTGEFCLLLRKRYGLELACVRPGKVWQATGLDGYTDGRILCGTRSKAIVVFNEDFDESTSTVRLVESLQDDDTKYFLLQKECSRFQSTVEDFSVQGSRGLLAFEDACSEACPSGLVVHWLYDTGVDEFCLNEVLEEGVGARFLKSHPTEPLFAYSFRKTNSGLTRAEARLVSIDRQGNVDEVTLPATAVYFPFADESALAIGSSQDDGNSQLHRCSISGTCTGATVALGMHDLDEVAASDRGGGFAVLGKKMTNGTIVPWSWLFDAQLGLRTAGPIPPNTRNVGFVGGTPIALVVERCDDEPENNCASLEVLDW